MLKHLLLNPSGYSRHLLRAVLQIVAIIGLRVALPAALAAVIALVLRSVILRRRLARFALHARQVIILAPPVASPDGALVLWTHLTGLLRSPWRRLVSGQPHLAFEYQWTDAGAQISMWVPGTVPPGLVERAIEAAWPGALTRTIAAQSPIPAGADIATGRLELARPDHYPLRADHDADPLRAIFAAAEGRELGDATLWQVLARPVAGRRLIQARHVATRLAGGGAPHPAARMLDLLTPRIARNAPRPTLSSYPERSAEIRAILGKASFQRWAVAIRYAVTAPAGPGRASAAGQARLRGRAHALASTSAVFASNWNRFARRPIRRPSPVLVSRRLGRGQLVAVPELAAIAHLPADAAVPGLPRAGARAVPAPPAIPLPGPDTRPLGETDAGARRKVAISVADARHHIHVLGETGVGKTTEIAGMVLADAAAGRGALVLDPKGDLINDLLARLPASVGSRTVLFDPADAGPHPALNVLGGPDSDLTVDHIVGIFRKIFIEFWGPRTDDVLRSSCLTLAGQPGATLADIPRLLGDAAYRQRATAGVRDPVLSGFWDWYESLSDAHRSFITGPLMNKLRAFLLRRFVRETVGAASSSFDMADVLDGGLCLVRLPKGQLGEDTTRLLGSVILARAWQTATHRARTGQAARSDCTLYIDECHNFLSLPHGMEDMLAEARSYRMSLVLVHQNLAQLSRELREGISANARNKIIFTCSPEDARVLERHVQPSLSAHDLSHLGAFQACARLVAGSAEQPAFTMRTLPLPAAIPGREEMIRRAARAYAGAGARGRRATLAPSAAGDPRLAPAGPEDGSS